MLSREAREEILEPRLGHAREGARDRGEILRSSSGPATAKFNSAWDIPRSNRTWREEIAWSDPYVRRVQPTLGYVFALPQPLYPN